MNRTLTPLVFAFGTSSLLLMDSAIKGSVILLGAACLAVMLKRDSAAMRHMVWLVAIVAMLVIPVFSVLLPRWHVLPAWATISQNSPAIEIPTRAVEMPRPFEAPTAESPEQFVQGEFDLQPKAIDTSFNSEALAQARLDATQNNVGIDRAPSDPSWSWMSGLPFLWSIGFGVLLLRLMAARWILWSNEQRATVIAVLGCPNDARKPIQHESDAAIVAAFENSHRQLGIRQRVHLLIDSERTIPVVWGIVWFRLMLPDSARQWSSEQLRSVLLHELAHIKRRDTIVQLLAQIACALHWFNPLVWFAAWRLHVERERACDDLVLAQGVRASAYAEHLLNVATKLSVARWTSACGLAMASHSPLESRLRAILSDRLNRRKVSTAIGIVGMLLGVSIAIPIAMLRAAAINKPETAEATMNAEPKDEHSKALFIQWKTSARTDGTIPGGRIGEIGASLKTFMDLNAGTEVANNCEAVFKKCDASHDWTPSDAVALLDEIETVVHSHAQWTLRISTGRQIHGGQPLPDELKDAPWGSPADFHDPSSVAIRGLRIAWFLEPNERTQPYGSVMETRVLFHNTSREAVCFATENWIQSGMHSAKDANGKDITVTAIEQLGRRTRMVFRLAPGEYAEVKGHSIGIGSYKSAEQSGNRAGAWIDAKEGDEITFVPGKLLVSFQTWQNNEGRKDSETVWNEMIAARVAQEGPWPTKKLDRELLLKGVTRDLGIALPTDESIASLQDDNSPDCLAKLTGRLQEAGKAMHFAGELAAGETKFLVTARMLKGTNANRVEQPKQKDARAYYEVWQRYARVNGDIPGALVGELAAAVKQFIKYNPTWETVPKLNEVLPRLDATHDWKPADTIALLDEVAGIQDTLLEPAPWKGTRDTIRQGDTLPKKYADVTWGEEQPSGLRAAWVLEPSVAEHRIGTTLKARLLVQNRGQVPVMLQVPTFHQGWVKGTDAKGSEVQVSGIDWTTMALINTVRLGPGAYVEINTAGVGIGPRAGMGPWAGPRVGSNVLAKPGDELTLTHDLVPLDGSEVGVSEDDPHVSGPGWWLAHIKTRLNRELPLPTDAAERTRLLDRAVRELFATAPTAEETAEFIADKTPDALDALAKRLATRVDVVSFNGKLPIAPVKFRVLDADANADKQPRVVLGPGEYPVGEGAGTLKIVGRPVGDRRTNDAQMLFVSDESAGIPKAFAHNLDIPDGWGTWAIVCRPPETFFYLLHKGSVRKIDYSKPLNITDTPANDLPAEFRDEVKRQLDIHEISAEQQAEIFEKPVPPVASLRSDVQETPKTAATAESPPKTTEQEPITAWGKEVGGLQAGLGFKAGEKRIYRHGESAALVVRVRNVGKETVKFEYLRQFFRESPPTVTDANGKSVPQRKPLVEGLRHVPVEVTLDPGKEIELTGSHPYYELTLELSPACGTGKVLIQYDQVFGNPSIGRINVDPVLSTLATGKLELEIKEPEKLPSEKEAPTVPSNAAAASEKPKPNYVTVVGQLLDDETGQPIEKAGWEWGMADPKKPDLISWGHSRLMGKSHPDGKFEMPLNISANGNHYPLRVYAAGYETTVVVDELAKPYPEKIERNVRLKRGRSITGVLRDHTGNPVANGWVFFIPKGYQTNIVESIPGTDAHQLPVIARDGAVSEVRTNENGTFALPTGVAGTLAASTDLVDLWPFPLLVDGYAELKMPAPSYLVIDLTYWYLDELVQKEKRAISLNSEDPNQCWIQVDQSGSSEPLWKNLGYRRQMLVFAKDPRAKLSKGVIVGHVVEGEMDKPIPDIGHNKNLSTKIRVALPPGNYRVQRLRTGPFTPVDEQNVELKSGKDTILSWARGDGSSVRGKATWPANMMFVRQQGEAPQKLDWTVPFTATVWIAPVSVDGKDGKPIDAAKIQADGSFFVPTNLDPGKYKATAEVSLPESDDSLRSSRERGTDCISTAEFTVPDPARGPFGSPPVELEIKMEVAENVRFLRANAPADPPKAVQPPAGKTEAPFTAWGKEVGGLQAGLGFKAGEKRAYSYGETFTVVVRVRNVGQNDIKFQYYPTFLSENSPTVLDETGKRVSLRENTLHIVKRDIPKEVNLAVGKEIELYERELRLASGNEDAGELKTRDIFPTGKFLIQHEQVIGNSAQASDKLDPTLEKLATGKLELVVKEVPAKHDETLVADEQARRHRKQLQGSWQVVEAHVGGTHAPREGSKEHVWTFVRDKLAFDFGDGDPMEMTYRIDEKQEPATIDLSPLDPREKGNLYKGIYELDGDQLKVHFTRNSAANSRPTEFKPSGIDRGMRYFVLKRAPKPDAPAEKEKEPFTEWGKEFGGLQAGLGFKAGGKRAYTHGEWATLVVRVRNVGKEEVKFQYLRQFFVGQPPTVFNEKGELKQLGRIAAFGVHIPVEVKLPAEKEIELYELKLDLESENKAGVGVPNFSTIYGTGKFQVQYEKVLGNSSSGSIKLDPALSKLATGKLELEIKPVAPVQQEAPKPKPGALLKPATEQKLKWGAPVNGLRMALAWPPTLGEPSMGDAEEFYLVVQNVSQAAVRLITGTAAPNPRRLNLMRRLNPNDETILSSRTVDDVPMPGDWLLQPRESALVRLIHSDEKMKDGRTFSAVKEHIVSVQPQYSYTADMTVEKAPEGAWTGKLTTGETRGSADVPRPKSGVPLTEQTGPMPPWGAEKDGLSAGIRVIGEARIGGEVKAELWVRNSGAKDVTFSQCPRADFGLHVVAQDKDGKEHSADITQFLGYPVLTRLLLPAGNIVKLKEFTMKLGAKKDAERVNLDLPPGEYKLRAVWSDTTSRVAPEGEWTGKLTTGEVDFKLAAANAGEDAGKPAAMPPGANIIKLPDAEYAKDGFPLDDLNGEGVMWNGGESGLSLGYRITGDEWRILGKELKVELWVRNAGKEDVKFQILRRTDEGLRVKLTGKDGKEHFARRVPSDVLLFGMKHLLSPGQCIKVNDFSVGLLPPEQNAQIGNELRFFVSPGWYQLVCEEKVPGFTATGGDRKQTVPGAGEWTGKITTRSLNVEVVAPDAPAPTPRIEHADVNLEKDGTLYLNRKKVTLDELKALAAQDAKKRFTIRADKDVPYAKVIEVMEALKAAGVTEFSFSVVAPDAPAHKPRIEHADVNLEKDGTLYLNRKKVTLDELKALAAQDEKKRFTIRAEKDVPYAKVIEVVEALKAAGVTEFSFSEARVGDGKYRVANRTGIYEFDDKHGFSICRPSGHPQWFTVNWPAEGDRPACALRTFPNVSDKTDGQWAVVWEPGTDVLWWVDDSEVGKMTLTNPAHVIVDREGRTNNFSRDFGLPEEVKTEFRRLGFVIDRDKTPGLGKVAGNNTGGNSGEQTIVSAEFGWWCIEGTVTDTDGKPLANVLVRVSTNQEVMTEKTDAKGAYRVNFSLPLQLLAHSRAVTVKPVLEGFTERDIAKSGEFNVLLRAGEQPQHVRLAGDKDFQPGPIPRFAENDLLPSQLGVSPGKPGRADFVMLKTAK